MSLLKDYKNFIKDKCKKSNKKKLMRLRKQKQIELEN